MSATLPDTTAAAPPTPGGLASARAELSRLRRRVRIALHTEGAATTLALLVAFAVPSFVTDRLLRLELPYRAALLASFVGIAAWLLWTRVVRGLRVALSDAEIALAVERRAPQMHEALISSLSFEERLASGDLRADSPALMRAVVADVQARSASIPFAAALDRRRLWRHRATAAAAVAAFAGWALVDAASLRLWAQRNVLLGAVDWPRATTLAFADGGATLRLPQGDSATIVVAARGEVPDQVFLRHRFASGERGESAMSRSLDDTFTLTLDRVLEDAELQALGGDALPVTMRLEVVERPRIDELTLTVVYPAYMERSAETVPATQGDLRLPRGALLQFAGRSSKALAEAFLLVGDDRKVPLVVDASQRGFAGELQPEASGLLTVDVVDRDRLGAGAPPRLALRIGDDQPPKLDYKLRGIGAMVTSHALLPGTLTVRDDFGLRKVAAALRVVDESSGAETPAPVDVPFEPVVAVFGTALQPSTTKHETTASVDLGQWNPVPDENAPENRIRPGMALSLRYEAVDNFGPGEPHVGYTETMGFRVVTREQLVEDLRRRQFEQRRELLQLIQEQRGALAELRENALPAEAGDKRAQVEARLEALARQQQGLGRRVEFVGESYQRILWEYENNRLWDQAKIRQAEAAIPVPLAEVGTVDLPASARLVRDLRSQGTAAARDSAASAYARVVRRLEEVAAQMEQAENLAALLEDLRIVINLEQSAIQQVESRVRAAEQDLFGPGKDKK